MKLSAVLLLSFLGLAMCSSCPWTQVKLGRLNRESIKQLEDMDPFAKECIDENVNLMFSESLCGPPADTQDQVVSVAYEALKGVKMLLQNCTTWKRQQLDLLKNYLSQQVSALHSCVSDYYYYYYHYYYY
ncbi:interferon a3-like [Arapaima gigas]